MRRSPKIIYSSIFLLLFCCSTFAMYRSPISVKRLPVPLPSIINVPKRNFWFKVKEPDVNSKSFKFNVLATRSAFTGFATGVVIDGLLNHSSLLPISCTIVGLSAAWTANAWQEYKKIQIQELQELINQKTDAEKFRQEVACIMQLSKKNRKQEGNQK